MANIDMIARGLAQQANNGVATNASQLAAIANEKADKTYVDNVISAVSASPAGVFATLADLQSDVEANTENGKQRIYIVAEDGKWYYWNGSAWTAGGQYQSTGIADKSVTPEKTSFLQVSTNLLDKSTFIDGYKVSNTTGEPIVDETYILSDFIKVKPNTMYYFKYIYSIGRYDADKNFINLYSPTPSGAAVNSYRAEYIRVTTHQSLYNMAQINEGEEELPYEPFGVKLCSNIEIEDKNLIKMKQDLDKFKEDFIRQFPPNNIIKNEIKNGNFEKGYNFLLADNWSIATQHPMYVKYNFEEKSQKIDSKYRNNHLSQAVEILGGNKYLLKFLVKKVENRDTEANLIIGFANSKTETLKEFISVSDTQYNTADYTEITILLNPSVNYSLLGFSGNGGVKSNAWLKNVLLINLTKTFGVGKEPSVAEFNTILDRFPDRWFDGVEHIKTLGELITDLANGKTTAHSIKKKPILPLEFEQMTEKLYLLGTAYDGNLYGVSYINGGIRKSIDGGITFVQGAFPNIGQIACLTVFSNGSVVAISTDGKFAHSEGFDKPFTIVKETGATFAPLNFSSYDNGIDRYILASEYGHTSTMKKIWLSKDGGLTYSVLKEGDTLYTGNNHWHTATFDPYSGGIFASQGDGNNARLYFTPDFGITWNYIEGTQPTAIYPFPNRVIFGRDNTGERPGIHEWDRDEIFPTSLKDALTFREDRWSYNFYPSNTKWNNANPNEYYLAFPSHIGADELSYIYATGDGGESWHKVYENLIRLVSLTGIDKQGYIYATDRDYKLYRAKRLFWEYDTV